MKIIGTLLFTFLVLLNSIHLSSQRRISRTINSEHQDNSPPINRIPHPNNLNNPNQNINLNNPIQNNDHINPNQIPPGTHVVIQNGVLRPVHGNSYIQPIYNTHGQLIALNEGGQTHRLIRNSNGRQISYPISHPPGFPPFPRRPAGNN